MYKCKYCGKEFKRGSSVSVHEKYCSQNPSVEENKRLLRKKSSKKLKKSNARLYGGAFKLFKVKCHKCGKEFEVREREKLFPQKEKYYCSRSCANSRDWSENKEANKKRSLTLRKRVEEEGKWGGQLHEYNNINSCIQCKRVINRRLSLLKKKKEKVLKYTNLKQCPVCGYYNTTNLKECKNTIFCGGGKQKLKAFIKLGFKEEVLGNKDLINKEIKKIKSLLEKEYYDNRLSLEEINKKYKVYKNNADIVVLFRFFEIERRGLSEACRIALQEGRLSLPIPGPGYKYKHGWHTSWNGKIGYYGSSYEADYFKILDEKKIDYYLNPRNKRDSLNIVYYDTVREGYRTAIPDFYLPETNTIVEVKCSYTLYPQEMADKIKEYKKRGYNFKLVYEHVEESF